MSRLKQKMGRDAKFRTQACRIREGFDDFVARLKENAAVVGRGVKNPVDRDQRYFFAAARKAS